MECEDCVEAAVAHVGVQDFVRRHIPLMLDPVILRYYISVSTFEGYPCASGLRFY
jgi:hypothetical protein